ncbi:hypothetical protein T492DRAFT_1119199 [Pavlovales sp. CCMP2436]|nr:hypothetical protein T492DRAFT_1119199 [Pavlovales sp. CCMP2436]
MAHVSELKLTTDLETASTKLATETLTNPLASTFTLKLRNVPLADFSVLVRRIPVNIELYYSRWFYWNAIDTPSQVIAKWNDQMRPFINGYSFGHLALSYDTDTSKFLTVFDYSTDYGTPEGFGWFSTEDGDDPSKDNLGLNRTPSDQQPGWTFGVGPRPLPKAAGYYMKMIKIGVFVTGSTGTIPRQVDFDISQTAAIYNTIREKYTMIINHSNEVSFFAGATEIIRDVEAGPTRLWGLI